jgi:hypothetical protein
MVDFKPHKLVDTISALENMHGIDRVLLSEEISSVPINGENIWENIKQQ